MARGETACIVIVRLDCARQLFAHCLLEALDLIDFLIGHWSGGVSTHYEDALEHGLLCVCHH